MIFDPTAMAFYAAVCGSLAAFAPSFGGRVMRAGLGIIVGLIAAAVLPMIRGMMGY